MREAHWAPTASFNAQISDGARDLSAAAPSPLRHVYTVETALASDAHVRDLDAALSASLENASSTTVDGVAAADSYYHALSGMAPRGVDEHAEVTILIYAPRAVPGKSMYGYGYVAGSGGDVGDVGVVGIASSERFLFIDTAARPFLFDDSAAPTEGELLLTASRNQAAYTAELGRILHRLLTPRAVGEMQRFPPESRFVFELMKIDASAVVGRFPGTGGGSQGHYPVGASFEAKRFQAILEELFATPAFSKAVSVHVSPLNTTDVAVSMAVSRAFRKDGLHLILDPDTLLRDLVLHHGAVRRDGSREEDLQYRSHADSSFMLHVPLFLFSFADDSRLVHFGDGEAVRAKCIGGQAVVMVENRLRRDSELHQDITSFAVKQVLELLCGIAPRVLDLVDMARPALPPLVKDIARRNVLERQLTWSMRTAVGPAGSAVLAEDLEAVPASDSVVGKSIYATGVLLSKTLEAWKRASGALDGREIEDISLRLQTSVEELRERKHEELCSRSLSEEVELEVGHRVSLLHWWIRVVLPAFLGVLTSSGVFLYQKRAHSRRIQLGISALSPTGSSGSIGTPVGPGTSFVETSSQWFSTLTSRPTITRSKLS